MTTTDAPKRFDLAVTVPATVDQVWDALTTPSGLTAWLAPFAKVELTVGGPWQVSFTAVEPGDEWDNAFDYLATGNAQLLEALYHRFAVGPEAWK